MLSAVQHNLPSTEFKSNNKIGVLTRKKAIENFRCSKEDITELITEDAAIDEDLQLADRVFCATIHKFTKQNCPDPSLNKKRSTRYSFLENWFLHKIYSKSQQTLLGVYPVKPAVILSGDDFMFTPPFLQSPPPQPFEDIDDEEYYYDEDEHWETNEYLYSLSPCPESKQAADNDSMFYRHQDEGEEDCENNKLKMLSTAFLKSPSLLESPPCFYNQDDIYNFVAENIQLEEEDIFLEDDRIRALNDIRSFAIDTQQTRHEDEDEDEDDSLSGLSDPTTNDSDEPDLSYSSTTITSGSYEEERQDMLNDDEVSGSYHSTTGNIVIPINNKTNEDDVSQITQVSPVTRSSTFLSQRSSLDDDSSVHSYQSLADIINSQQMSQDISISSIPSRIYHYGSVKSQALGSKMKSFVNNLSGHHANNDDEEMGLQTQQVCHNTSDAPMSLWACVCIYVISALQIFVNSIKRVFNASATGEREPLL
ncbi:hypothetical protein A0J61_01039 [Choanephora cucurbitarum]|uniref:Uncharacterized protein n=1 Tax=Choanephora cucurbitarum TaxID=101091 RepID=A0A1C7NPT5_9FUNG|nr:hypothetical protein A0J61_01039 [Choanephora cucurbitarum]